MWKVITWKQNTFEGQLFGERISLRRLWPGRAEQYAVLIINKLVFLYIPFNDYIQVNALHPDSVNAVKNLKPICL